MLFAAVVPVAAASAVPAAGESSAVAAAVAKRPRSAFDAPPITLEDVAKVVRTGPLLNLRDAIPRALRENLGLALSRTEKSIVEDTPDIAQAEFDPRFSFSSTYDTAGTTPYWKNDASRTSTQGWNSSAEISKKFSYGTQARIYGNFNRGFNLNSDPYAADSSVSAGVSLTQPLMKGFGEEVNLAPLVTARQNVLKSGLSLRKTTLDLIYDTEVAYWNLSASYALVSARLSSLRHAESVLEQTRKMRELQSATLEDILQAEAEVASRRVNLVSARQSVENQDDELRRLLGEKGDDADPVVYRVAPLSETAENRETRSFGEWISAVRAFDIDLQIQEINREQAALNRMLAEDDDRPELNLVVGAEASGQESSPLNAFRGVAGNDRRGYDFSVGIEFSVPIGFRESEARLRQAMKEQRSVEIETAQALQSAMFDARSAWRSLEAALTEAGVEKDRLKKRLELSDTASAKAMVYIQTLQDSFNALFAVIAEMPKEQQKKFKAAVAKLTDTVRQQVESNA